MQNDSELLATCLQKIEQKLNWGESKLWSNQDFGLLSEQIFAATGINLSPSTLKRIWGKVKYDSAPTPTTLNTLAQFLGFDHWRAFRQAQFEVDLIAEKTVIEVTEKQVIETKTNKKYFSIIVPIIGIGLLGFLFLKGYFSNKSETKVIKIDHEKYKFTARKIVPNTIPNSVVFDYDASASTMDSVFIQQTWDQRLTKQIAINNHQHTSIYYYPGFFQAKLLIGKQIVKETEVFIKTDGWLPLIVQEKVPIYLKKEEAIANGKMALPISILKSKNIVIEPNAPIINFMNYRDFGVNSSDFAFETILRNDYNEGSSICQKTGITLICKSSMIYLPLSTKGCASDNNIYCLGQEISGKEHDLSGFGVDFKDFTKVRLKVFKGKADFYVNEKLVYHLDEININSPIVGIIYRFQGAGAVDYVSLKDGNGRDVYKDEF